MPLTIVSNDITRMQVDAIVNAANERLLQGGGVCGAIFAAAGPRELQAACNKIGHCDTGSAVATPAFRLPAKHVIHTVGPIWRGGDCGEEAMLRSCYLSSLELAFQLKDKSVAFPLISSGIYGYPKNQAIDVAIGAIRDFILSHEIDVRLIIFDAASLRAADGRFASVVRYVDDLHARRSQYQVQSQREFRNLFPHSTSRTVEASPFSETLLQMIGARNLSDEYVYKRANMSFQLFSKIVSTPDYRPRKRTVLALAIALELTLDEANLLLARAGFALTQADSRDAIVEYFIIRGSYDIHEINLALFSFDLPLLG